MSNYTSKSSAQLLKILEKAESGKGFTVDHIEMAQVLNKRKKLPKNFANLLPDSEPYWDEPTSVADNEPVETLEQPVEDSTQVDDKSDESETRVASEKPEKKTSKPKRVRFENPRELQVGDSVEFFAGSNGPDKGTQLRGVITGFQKGAREDQVYARIKGEFGTKVKRTYACRLIVE